VAVVVDLDILHTYWLVVVVVYCSSVEWGGWRLSHGFCFVDV
jgi:hypothetical protein